MQLGYLKKGLCSVVSCQLGIDLLFNNLLSSSVSYSTYFEEVSPPISVWYDHWREILDLRPPFLENEIIT